VVSIFRTTRRLVAVPMPAVALRNGTNATVGPMPIRSIKNRAMTMMGSIDVN
jgi:hypothetical protein